jgi:succinyl-CoA synthetase beta subunit
MMQQVRNLSIHEYRSAKLLESYGIGVPNGDVAFSADEAEKVAKSICMLHHTNTPVHTQPD